MSRPDSQLDSTIEVVTPENIAFHYRLAGPFRRLAALLLDYGLRVGAYFALIILTILLFTLVAAFIPAVGGLVRSLSAIAVAAYIVGWFALDWFYGGFFETYWNGQTPGKRIFGLRVLTIHGEPINGLQAVLRNVLRYVDLFPLLSLQIFDAFAEGAGGEGMPPMYMIPTLMVGLLSMTLTRRCQRLGDLVCGTMVVLEERPWLTGVVRLEDPRAAQLAALLPADFVVSPSLARSLAMYVDRRRFFAFGRRREIAQYLAVPLLDKFRLPKDTSYDLLLCALYYRAFIADLGDSTAAPFRTDEPFRQSSLGPSPPGSPFPRLPVPTAAATSPPAEPIGAPLV